MGSKPKGVVRNGGRGVIIPVTEEIINTAVVRDSGHCMIADAIKAVLPEVFAVSVDLQTIRFSDRKAGKRYIYLTPAPAQKALVNFDQGIRPETEFSVYLRKPAQIIKVNPGGVGRRKPREETPNMPSGEKKVLVRDKRTGRPGDVVVLGGHYPPAAALSSTRGRRRTFGLRSLKP